MNILSLLSKWIIAWDTDINLVVFFDRNALEFLKVCNSM